ncbi:hypothetical protein ACFLSX_02920 [Calditrichota bacterium]
MSKLITATLIWFLFIFSNLTAQELTGTYISNQDGNNIKLNLSVNTDGTVTGSIRAEGIQYTIEGQNQNNRLIGVMNALDESYNFSIQLSDNNLVLTIADAEEIQEDYYDSSETIIFKRVDTQKKSLKSDPPESSKNKSGKVVINGLVLSNNQISELEQTYQVKPLPGNYWYDINSGLYGVIGYPTFGFMLPGHDFGKLKKNASNGDTGVFVNERELPQSEWAVWSQLLGYWIQPGNYWLDENGNAGYVGNPIPTENLYIAAQRNAYGGSSGGGDNFWSSRFGAGNYDSGNQQGYISVPGHGPIGYGF